MFGPQVDTLAGRNILICHVASERATKLTTALFKGTTAQLVRLDIAQHDQLMSYVLGLSHLINMVFARVLTNSSLNFKELRQVASTTFNAQLQVTTPVIQENQELYYSIQTANSFTPKLIEALEEALKNYQDAVANRDFKRFATLMQDSKAYWEQTS
jgi:chorismate mutase/prephenate dehydrogenase